MTKVGLLRKVNYRTVDLVVLIHLRGVSKMVVRVLEVGTELDVLRCKATHVQ